MPGCHSVCVCGAGGVVYIGVCTCVDMCACVSVPKHFHTENTDSIKEMPAFSPKKCQFKCLFLKTLSVYHSKVKLQHLHEDIKDRSLILLLTLIQVQSLY